MQDIEALTERILLIGRGKILLDGTLSQLKKKNSTRKTLSVDFLGKISEVSHGMSISKMMDGHAEIVVETDIISVSEALSIISNQVEISDLSVTGTTTEELVVSLYREFEI